MTQTQSDHTDKSTCQSGGFSLLMTAFSLVPEQLLDEENHDLWVNFLRERVPHNQQLVETPFPALRCVCLHEISGSEREHAIPTLLQKTALVQVPTYVLAIRQEGHLAVVCMKDGKLQLGNIYEADTKEQTLYWLLKIYDQLHLDSSTPLYIRCGDGTRRLLFSHLNTLPLPE